MNVIIAFFGFIRNIIEINEVNKFISLFPANTTFQVVVFSPNKIDEFDKSSMKYETMYKIRDIFLQHDQIKTIDFHYYKYSPYPFIKKAIDLALPQKTMYHLYPYRILSLHFGISGLCKMIMKENYVFDYAVLTRFDIFGSIDSLGDTNRFTEKNSVYIWRLQQTNLWNEIPVVIRGYAEDLLFISSKEGINHMQNLFDSEDKLLPEGISQKEMISEKIIGKFLSAEKNLILYPLSDIIYKKPANKNKYSPEFEKKINELYEKAFF